MILAAKIIDHVISCICIDASITAHTRTHRTPSHRNRSEPTRLTNSMSRRARCFSHYQYTHPKVSSKHEVDSL
jgi:hypothetical protein